MSKLIGEVTHYFNKAGVAVIKLKDKISIGDKIKIKRNERETEEDVRSMQIDYEDVDTAQKGEEVAVKIENSAKEGDQVYKVE